MPEARQGRYPPRGEHAGRRDTAKVAPVVAGGSEADGPLEHQHPGRDLGGAVGERRPVEYLPGRVGVAADDHRRRAQAESHEVGGAVGLGELSQLAMSQRAHEGEATEQGPPDGAGGDRPGTGVSMPCKAAGDKPNGEQQGEEEGESEEKEEEEP